MNFARGLLRFWLVGMGFMLFLAVTTKQDFDYIVGVVIFAAIGVAVLFFLAWAVAGFRR
jgi:hypothetical protein